jgi:diacylglycerol kinase
MYIIVFYLIKSFFYSINHYFVIIKKERTFMEEIKFILYSITRKIIILFKIKNNLIIIIIVIIYIY